MYKVIFLAALALAISACGGGGTSDGESGSAPGASSSSSNSSSSGSGQASAELLAEGLQQYEAHCLDCHDDPNIEGRDGMGLIDIDASKYSGDALANFITSTMPSRDPMLCPSSCAIAISAFIRNNFSATPGGAGNNGNPPSNNGDSSTPPVPKGQVIAPPVTIHRLNRSEYNLSVQTLFNTSLEPANSFPEDDFGYGFNNIADVLSVTLTHVEQYEKAANVLLDEALGAGVSVSTQEFDLENYGLENGRAVQDFWMLYSNGNVTVPVTTSAAGEYDLIVYAGQQAGGPDPANLRVLVNGVAVQNFSVEAPLSQMQAYTLRTQLVAGANSISLAFTNDYYEADVADLNLGLDTLDVVGPQGASSAIVQEAFSCGTMAEDRDCARTVINRFTPRAWRMPVASSDIDALVSIYDFATAQGATHPQSLRQALKAVLLSPNFLFRSEIDTDLGSDTPRQLNAYELVSRLSFFIWGRTPTDALLALAADGSILQEDVLRQQVQSMLDDDRSKVLVENFAVQWLKFDKILEANPDLQQFSNFNPQLVEAMRIETRLFLKEIIDNNAPVTELFTADYTYLNSTLAAHYGVSGFSGESFQRHTWSPSDGRRGLLGQASVLTATSHPAKTSPVLRGVWVLQNLLCDEPPPPPPGVENLAEDSSVEGLTTRQRFELHRNTETVCFSCHQSMDPIGFGLENFNPVGQWRAMEGGDVIDATGTLPNGEEFDGAVGLANVLAQSYRLPMCTTEHLMTFALGRGVEALGYGDEKPDYPLIYDIYQKTQNNGFRIRDIIEEIVLSDAFRMRSGADAQEEAR